MTDISSMSKPPTQFTQKRTQMNYRIFIIASFCLLLNLQVYADPASPYICTVPQTDGTTLQVQLHGDEHYNWMTTSDGYIIDVDSLQTYRYLQPNGTSLQYSRQIAHNPSERDVMEMNFLQQYGDITIESVRQARNAVLQARQKQQSITTQTTGSKVVGKRKILSILVEFPDKKITKERTAFENLWNQIGYRENSSVGSVRDFYLEASYRQLDVTATIVEPIVAPKNSTAYKKNRGEHNPELENLVIYAIEKVSQSVDFSTFDENNDGFVDGVQIIFAGYGKSGNSGGLIWPFKSTLSNPITKNGKKISAYFFSPELSTNGEIAVIGTICHELGHILGAPDFYDTDYEIDGQYFATGVYDLMGGGNWNDKGKCPAHPNPYIKSYIYGWANPVTIMPTTKSYTMYSSTQHPIVYRINTHTDGEFFLLENREQVGFDAKITSGGLVVYHIHKDMNPAARNFNNHHPLWCYIVNSYANTNPTSDSSSYGTRSASRAFPGYDNKQIFLTSTSVPSLTAWDGSSTGIDLCFIKRHGSAIQFTINPQIQGLSQLCGEETYCIGGNVPGSASISWRYSSPIKPASKLQPVLRIKDADSDCAIVQRGFEWVRPIDSSLINPPINPPIQMSVAAESSASLSGYKRPYVGNATLFVTVSSAGEEYTLSKTITLPQNITPKLNINPMNRPIWVVGQEFSFTEQNCGSLPADQIKWYVRYPQATEDVVLTGRTVRIKPTTSGKLTIRIVNDCGCETKNEVTYTFSVSEQHVQLLYANPANGSVLNVKVVNNAAVNTLAAPMQTYMCDSEEKVYTIELWSGTLGKISSTTTSQDQVNIDIAGLPNGWYQLLLVQDGKIIETDNVLLNK